MVKIIQTSGRRKTAIARATLRQGKGKIRINKVPLDFYEPKMYRLKLREPFILAEDLAANLDIDINVTKGMALTNMRQSFKNIKPPLTPPVDMSIEQALDFIEDDELLEVTPQSLRLRKKFLKKSERDKNKRKE